ncbi:hypothetical protein Y032_0317g2305 [Ancylostoma ceylanicum]|uniref:Uncharacterized protein n=1 Tax=Ancylostoma ceylanicum TaxID=53326 RepID=A0A016S207_9BILA|nr:hypothetical protein Y032_0317g2305 [Ancylostoma ceylanicum]
MEGLRAPLSDAAKASRQIISKVTIDSQEKNDGRVSSSSPSGDSTTVEDARLVPVRENGNHFEAPCSTLGSPCSSMTHFLDSPDSKISADDWQGVTLLVGENSSRGSEDSFAQMLQLMSWFSSASCIDWVFLLCVVSRDIVRLRGEINVESVKKAGVEAYQRTMSGCGELVEWATQNWYEFILLAFSN